MVSEKNKKKSLIIVLISALCAFTFAIAGIVLVLERNRIEPEKPVLAQTTESTTEEPQGVRLLNTVTVGSAGDVLLHLPIIRSAEQGDGKYNFDSIFTYSSSLISDCDYFVANLETTLGGTENGRTYSGFPCFNSPDSIVDSLKKAGVDCLLTANNHTYDTGAHGVQRTLEVVKKAGLSTLGTIEAEGTDKKYLTKEIGGINFGFLCFTFETDTASAPKALNGINVSSEAAGLINSFNYNRLDEFYLEVRGQLDTMKNAGAEVTVAYIHWGNEYQTYTTASQQEIAQKLCDLGVDVIIGGHPHVVQPIDLLTSADGKNKTVCVYSLGNMVSNQRRAYMSLKTGHTEDGLIFLMTFSKYSDGTVTFDSIEAVPTWVHLYTSGGKNVYNVVTLSESISASALGLDKSSGGLSSAKESYSRTMAIVGEGAEKCNSYLAEAKKAATEMLGE